VGDWSIAARLAEQYSILLRAAEPENVAEAIGQVRPWALIPRRAWKVSSRRKDAAKMRQFIEQCQRHMPVQCLP